MKTPDKMAQEIHTTKEVRVETVVQIGVPY